MITPNELHGGKIIVCDTPEAINAYRMLTLRSAMKLHLKGIRFRFNPFTVAKAQYQLKGTNEEVLKKYEELLVKLEILHEKKITQPSPGSG